MLAMSSGGKQGLRLALTTFITSMTAARAMVLLLCRIQSSSGGVRGPASMRCSSRISTPIT